MIDLKDIEDIEPMEGPKPEIDLPFKDDKTDIGEWVYTHQVGLFVLLIAYFILMILFVTAKITISTSRNTDALAIDLQLLAELEFEREELLKSIERLQKENEPIDWSEVENQISNESSAETERIASEVEQMLNDAAERQRTMESNRAAYEQGLAEAQDLIDNPPPLEPFLESQKEKRGQDIKSGGSVTVSYTLDNPVRHSVKLVVPAYLCEGGGEVSIRIAVNQQGEVISAKVISGGDECMQESALASALASRFDINRGAPLKHMGLIIYTFVPQSR